VHNTIVRHGLFRPGQRVAIGASGGKGTCRCAYVCVPVCLCLCVRACACVCVPVPVPVCLWTVPVHTPPAHTLLSLCVHVYANVCVFVYVCG
jgi:hypothetical protein